MPLKEYIKKIKPVVSAAVLTVLLSGCMADDPFSQGEGDPNASIMIGANVNPAISTRAYIEEGEINDSTYFLIYNKSNSSSTYGHAKVEFGNVEGPTTGYAFYKDGETDKELKWLNVYGQGKNDATFYLSNIEPTRYTTSSSTSLLYWRLNNPIQAAPLDKKWGSNDIILGSRKANSTEKRVDFDLNHILSLLKVNVEVYGASDSFFVDLDQAEVTISNVCRTLNAVYISSPESYAYNASVPSSGTSSGYYNNPGVLTLAAPGDDTPDWEINPSKGSTGDGSGNVTKRTYSTYQFVMPPQTIPPSPIPAVTENGYTGTRPRLSIKIPKSAAMGGDVQGDVTYSGYIPEVMFELDENGAMKPTPYNIALRSGYQLNITATINSPETELVFAPVTIEPWVSKGTFSISTKQAGIYNEVNFRNMIEAYNEGDLDELLRYGYIDGEGNFVFQLWAGITLEDFEIREKMTSAKGKELFNDFCFLFNGYSFTIGKKGETKPSDPILSGSEGQAELFNIVTGSTGTSKKEFRGLRTTEDLKTVTDAIRNAEDPDVITFSRYGTINNSDNTIDFEVANVIDIPIADVFQLCTNTQWGYSISFTNRDNCYVNAVFSSADNVSLPLVTRNDYDVFSKIVFIKSSTPSDISSPEEFYLLVESANIYYRYFNPIITLFAKWVETGTGFSQGQSWNYNMAPGASGIDIARVSLCFLDDGDTGKARTYLSAASFPVEGFLMDNEKVPFSIARATSNNSYQNSGSLRPFFYGNTAIPALTSIVTAYNANTYRTLWGYFKFLDDKWRFDYSIQFNNSSAPSATYDQVFGTMTRDDASGRYDYEFKAGSRGILITSVPDPETGIKNNVTFYNEQNDDRYPNDMKALKAMFDGTYWAYYEQWKQSRIRRK